MKIRIKNLFVIRIHYVHTRSDGRNKIARIIGRRSIIIFDTDDKLVDFETFFGDRRRNLYVLNIILSKFNMTFLTFNAQSTYINETIEYILVT